MSRGAVQVGANCSDDRVSTTRTSRRCTRRVYARETTKPELTTGRQTSPDVVSTERRLQPGRRLGANQVPQTRTELPASDRALEQRAEARLHQ